MVVLAGAFASADAPTAIVGLVDRLEAVVVLLGVGAFGAVLALVVVRIFAAEAEVAGWTHTAAAWLPLIVVAGLAVAATSLYLDMRRGAAADLTIDVVASRWQWRFEYRDDAGAAQFGYESLVQAPRGRTENRTLPDAFGRVALPLVIPAQRKVRLRVTSGDVLHAFWVPDLAVRRTAVPGVLAEVWLVVRQPGVFRGQCGEFCGSGHGFMPIVVEVVAPEDFERWRMRQFAEPAAGEQPKASVVARRRI